jgi:hypothetical protein
MDSTRLRPPPHLDSSFVRFSLAPHFDPRNIGKHLRRSRIAGEGYDDPGIRPEYWIELITTLR